MSSSRTNGSRFERRLSRTVALSFTCCSVIYVVLFLGNYENNILIFLANVFAPALLIIAAGVTVLAELLALARKKPPQFRERVVRTSLIVSFLIPTVAGEIRAHPRRNLSGIRSDSQFTVLDANLLGPVDVDPGFYDEVARRRPDIITLQELNPTVAERLSARLGEDYPCKVVEAKPAVFGMGVFSRFPCGERDSSRFPRAIGVPQIVDVQLPNNKTVGVVNVHTVPPHILIKGRHDDNDVQQLSNAIIERELFVQDIIKTSRLIDTDAAVLAGDFNATTRNRVYRLVRQMGLFDAFSSGSRLRGGTWPGPQFPLPSWMMRIDFIFHCAGLTSIAAETLPSGYGSDHRGVVATLAFVQ